jgi:hypothetical protein
MKSITCLALVLISLVLSACRKEKTRAYSGQLLLSKKFPTPLVDRAVEVFQRGSGSGAILPMGASAAVASSVTDANGYFSMRFTFGKGTFIVFPAANTNPLVLSNSYRDTSYPSFRIENFSDSLFFPRRPIFIGKTIDTLIISVSLLADLAPADTIGLRGGGTVTGKLDREYTGRTGAAGAEIVLDTIINALFTEFDYIQRKFRNQLYGGRKYMTPAGYVAVWAERERLPSDFPENDEGKREITIFFNK